MQNLDKIKKDVTSLINEIDPWDLIKAGAPDDEYNAEVNQTISLYINNQVNKEKLEKIWGSESRRNSIEEITVKLNKYFAKDVNGA